VKPPMTWIFLGLVGLLAIQLVVKWGFPQAEEREEPTALLRSGAHVSEVGIGGLAEVVVARCGPVYFVDPLCPGCSTLAEKWKGEGRPTGVWVISRDKETAAAFVEERGVPRTDVFFLADVKGIVPDLRAVGVYAAPTSAILDACGILWHVRGGPLPVSEETVERYCNQECTQ
jgi:hypothetical protein